MRNLCPLKVFDIEEIGSLKLKLKYFFTLYLIDKIEAVVKNPRDCTMCRECIRDEEFTDAIELGKERDHYICTKNIILNIYSF